MSSVASLGLLALVLYTTTFVGLNVAWAVPRDVWRRYQDKDETLDVSPRPRVRWR